MTLTDLAEANGVDAPYATLIVDKLEAHGLVERHRTPRTDVASWSRSRPGREAIATAEAILRRPPRAIAHCAPRTAAT